MFIYIYKKITMKIFNLYIFRFSSFFLRISYAVNTAIALVFSKLNEIDEYIVKPDDEEFEKLLNSDEDKIKFQMAIDELLRDNKKTKNIEVNNKTVTISID